MCQWARVEAHLNSIGEELLALYGPTPEGKPTFPTSIGLGGGAVAEIET